MKRAFLTKILGAVVLTFSLSAQAVEQCWKRESNPSSGKTFISEESWQESLGNWEQKEPETSSLLSLFVGNEVAKRSRKTARKLGSDKRAHCYTGCRISRTVDLETAIYAGWYKEHKDLTDCLKSSHFDPADYDATVVGGELGLEPGSCKTKCRKAFPLSE